MTSTHDVALMAHLMRRAGFGANPEELERRVAQGYEATVEELLDPSESLLPADAALLFRYMPSLETGGPVTDPGAANWLYHMINTQRPLEEKMALFWHGIFATGVSKVDHYNDVMDMIFKFRKLGLGAFRTLLIENAKMEPP